MIARKKNFSRGSEFRKDLVSGDWILVAAGRARRPRSKIKRTRLAPSKKGCPFENPQLHGSPVPILWLPHPATSYPVAEQVRYGAGKLQATSSLKDWWVQIIPNKYPAVSPHEICPQETSSGPYYKMDGIGFHEIIITRDHARRISEMTKEEAETLVYAYQERWRTLAREKCIEYILIFHNQGPGAGATIFHPHSQLIALPIVPPDVSQSLEGSRFYYTKKGKCVHCDMLSWERKQKQRIVYENKKFIVFEPFASRVSYETRIFPKKHEAHFGDIVPDERVYLADAMIKSLTKIKKALGDPDYNFFIHTAPAKTKNMDYYHWHIEILPKTAIWAGLELGSGIEVVAISPEEAASELKKA